MHPVGHDEKTTCNFSSKLILALQSSSKVSSEFSWVTVEKTVCILAILSLWAQNPYSELQLWAETYTFNTSNHPVSRDTFHKSVEIFHSISTQWQSHEWLMWTSTADHCLKIPALPNQAVSSFKAVLLWSWRSSIRLGPANPCEIDCPCSRGRTWCFLWLGSGVDYGVHQQPDWTLEIQFSVPLKNKPPTPQNLQWV